MKTITYTISRTFDAEDNLPGDDLKREIRDLLACKCLSPIDIDVGKPYTSERLTQEEIRLVLAGVHDMGAMFG